MKGIVKRVWWKIPLYSVIAGFVSWWLMVSYIGRLAIVKLPDGAITSNQTVWSLLSGGVFIIVLLIGGLIFFRKMTKKELLCSATVMFIFHIIMTSFSFLFPLSSITMFFLEIREWYSIVTWLIAMAGLNNWLGVVISGACVYLFVLFGKKN